MAGLDDPAASAPFGMPLPPLDLLAAAADVRLEALAQGEFADVVEVEAAVEAKTLWMVWVGDRPCDRDRGERRL
jgi:hypothetical protein